MIALYCPDVPPIPGGVSDHTLALARAIAARGAGVAVLARRGDPALLAPIPCVTGLAPADVGAAAKRLGARTVLIQYVPFLFARRGVSPAFSRGVGLMRDAGLTIAVFVHEPFVPFTRPTWLITGIPQRLQFRHLLRRASHVYTAVPTFAEIARRYAGAGPVVSVAPVGATIPVSPMSRADARRALGIPDDTVAIGIFSPAASGYGHEWIAAAARRLAGRRDVRWVRFGFGSDRPWPGYPAAEQTLVIGEGTPDKVAATMRAMDIAAAPYVDGLTLRRSGAMLALATGIATVSSTGPLFDPGMRELADCEPDPEAFAAKLERLVQDPEARAQLATRATNYPRLASVEALAQRLISDLEGGA